MTKEVKIIIQILFYIGCYMGLVWIFNHINPWISIGGIILLSLFILNKTIKSIKQNEKL